jgi:antitoxin (DNA-binding transcriptional repressor) of toxin-antitoxin stability system
MNHEDTKNTKNEERDDPIGVSVQEAQERREELASAALRGRIVLIQDEDESGLTVFQLTPVPRRPRKQPKAGSAKGLIVYMAHDFDAPLEDFREYMESDTTLKPPGNDAESE